MRFAELIQGLNEETKENVEAQSRPKKWTLRFSVRDIAGHESYMRQEEQQDLEYISIIKNVLAEDFIKPNYFQLPLLSSQFGLFHNSIKKVYDKLFKGQKLEVYFLLCWSRKVSTIFWVALCRAIMKYLLRFY